METKQSQAHNLTRQQIKELQGRQVREQSEPQTTGNKDSSYKFPQHEKHLVHVEMEVPSFDPHTGKKRSVPYTQKFGVKQYQEMHKNQGFAGYKVTVLHDPTEGGSLEGIAVNTAGGQSLGDRNHPDVIKRLLGGEKVEASEVANVTKQVDTMNKTELTELYLKLYGDTAPLKSDDGKDLTKADLIEKIKEKMAFLEAENKDEE